MIKYLKKPQVILSILILGGIIILSFQIYRYMNVCVTKGSDEVCYIGEILMGAPEKATAVISYEMLPKEYQKQISKEEYNNADEPLELLELYSKPIFQEDSRTMIDSSLSTTGYKKQPEGYFKVEEKYYFIRHEIDIKPDFISLELKVVRWYIEISEVVPPLNEQSSVM